MQKEETQKESSFLVQLPAPSTPGMCPLPDVDRRTVASDVFQRKMPNVFLWSVLLNLDGSTSFPAFSTLAPVILHISSLSCLLVAGQQCSRLRFKISNSRYFYIREFVHVHRLLAVNRDSAAQYADIWPEKPGELK